MHFFEIMLNLIKKTFRDRISSEATSNDGTVLAHIAVLLEV